MADPTVPAAHPLHQKPKLSWEEFKRRMGDDLSRFTEEEQAQLRGAMDFLDLDAPPPPGYLDRQLELMAVECLKGSKRLDVAQKIIALLESCRQRVRNVPRW